jgi:hypothetical protein
MADMSTALNGGYKNHFKDMIPDPLDVMRRLGLNVPNFNVTPTDAAEILPGAGIRDGFEMGKDMGGAFNRGDYGNAALLGAGSAAMYGSELLPGVIGSVGRKGVKAALSMTDALRGAHAPVDSAASVINDGKRYLSDAEQQAITAAEKRTYGIPTKEDYIKQANETGNLIDAPWRAKGPKISLEKMMSMEDALRVDAPPEGMYVPRNVITPEEIPIGSNLTNFSGDQSGIGILKNSLSGPSNVVKDGGFPYMQLATDDIWNSHENVSKGIQSIADAAPDKRTFGLTTDMTPIALHFNDMLNKRFFELFNNKAITNAPDVNQELGAAFKNAKNSESFNDFPGIESPKFKDWMDTLNGTNRSVVYTALDKGKMQKRGVPDLGEIKHSISRPEMRYTPTSNVMDPLVGFNVAEIIPGSPLVPNSQLKTPHGTYQMGMKGKYPGGLDVMLPRSVAYPDWYNMASSRGLGPSQFQGSFRQNKIVQPITQEWQDNAMIAREKVLKNK